MITMEDVAKAAGVSVSTVSRVCSGNASISEKTREKVQNAIKKLGYVSNFQASSLATHNSHTIGIVLPPSDQAAYQNTFFLEIIRGIGMICNTNKYMSAIITAQTEQELLQSIHDCTKSQFVSGYILLYSHEQDPVTDYLQQEQIPYVIVGKPTSATQNECSVDTDNILAGREVTEYLIAMGHRKIAFLSEKSNYNFSLDRKRGYLLALTEHNIPIEQNYIAETTEPPCPEELGIHAMLTCPDPPSAVIADDDMLAVSLIHAAHMLQIHVPGDLSVISFNDSLLARFCMPPLTSVNVHAPQLGTEAALRMIHNIEHPDEKPAKAVVPHQLIERESCIPPQAQRRDPRNEIIPNKP